MVAAGRLVGDRGNEGDHFVWPYNELKLMVVILLKGSKERSRAPNSFLLPAIFNSISTWAPHGPCLAPRPLSRWKFARKGRRFVTSHSRFALDSMRNHAKNEAPKEDTDTDQNFWMYKTQRKVVPSSRIFLPPCKKPLRNVVTGLFVGKGGI